ncbi:Phosphate-specific transport system accessory protein PhoU [Marine Group I thaumarchaeote SCGC AAA799-B03]|uniref:Phosphate-specific transport system accessory protein PhoU n=4 Tax=Marine Group I TaxID=905826 RepID=A0A087S7R5_9ARCH|nr:Phosphate-specific transport system accessory protein PhoU [Marine Group I thaumarchaeote SCGC AAA799-D11]KFM18860.1 Phosphate-specific transport system accessory protein PhoU [Marine Group I thaumarchaeote SCGC RSA3]KFM21769.1 Phosphate-specific transport system accessory protein PhoU [Marine Group I thaumarchaeote SCGC AAA799-B03]
MARLIDPSLQKLSYIMAEMGDMVIESISLAIDSYLDGTNTMDKVLALSDSIRSKYYEVEDLTFDMLLKFQPVADDFRLIRSSTEISYAFSRFGRYAYDITQVRDLFGDVSECTNASLIESTKKVKHMIKEAVMSFAELDVRKAVKIREDEKVIDQIYKDRLPKLIESNNTKCALAEALLLRYLERIGDHAVFMSDAINYIVTGKHRPSEARIASHTKSD